jgi:Rod binding domain-containing protein
MDSAKLLLTEPVSSPGLLEKLDKSNLKNASNEKKKKIAKDFESILFNRLLEEMKNSIVDWGQEKDAAAKQTEGIFWLYLGQDIAKNGGLGLWKDIYQFLSHTDKQTNTEQKILVDSQV